MISWGLRSTVTIALVNFTDLFQKFARFSYLLELYVINEATFGVPSSTYCWDLTSLVPHKHTFQAVIESSAIVIFF